jgi:hypothetical protein
VCKAFWLLSRNHSEQVGKRRLRVRHLQAGQLRAGAVQRGGGGGEAPPQGLPAVALDQRPPRAIRPRCAGLRSATQLVKTPAVQASAPLPMSHEPQHLQHLEAAQPGLLQRLDHVQGYTGLLATTMHSSCCRQADVKTQM